MQTRHKKYFVQTGFTLVESMVIVTIIGILSLIAATAIPRARDSQQLTVSAQQFQSLLSQAQQQAINEVRSAECLQIVGEDDDEQRKCSNVGVGIQGKTAVIFSDLDGNRAYNPPSDFLIATHGLSAGSAIVDTGYWLSLVFEATPPTVTFFADGRVVGPQTPATLVLTSGDEERSWSIYPFGRLEQL